MSGAQPTLPRLPAAHEIDLESLFDQLPIGVAFSADPACDDIRLNRALAAMLGYRTDANASKNHPDLHLPFKFVRDGVDIPAADLPQQVASRTGRAVLNVELDVLLQSGETRKLHGHAIPLRDSFGRSLGTVSFYEDVTDRTRAEAAVRRSNEDLQRFALVIAHDLQEPLRTISSYAESVVTHSSGALEAQSLELLRRIVESGDRMKRLIDSVLEFSRAHTGSARPPLRTDCNAILNWALMNLQTAIAESNATVSNSVLPIVIADEQLLRVFQNLLSNSLKYRGPEPPRIHVGARLSADGSEWIFSVADNGVGFDCSKADRLFGVFERLHGADIPGVGMGLAICKRIVERMGGRMWAESERGRGSTFYFTIPATAGDE